MEVTVTPKSIDRTKSKRRGIISCSEESQNEYPHYLQFYEVPPSEKVDLGEAEEMACDRLKALKALESISQKYHGKKYTEEYRQEACSCLRNQKFGDYVKSVNNDAEEEELRRKDHLSHYLLRLAFCRTEDNKNWFLEQETDLFRIRFWIQPMPQRVEFIRRHELPFEEIYIEDPDSKMLQKLISIYPYLQNVTKLSVFKVDFELVDNLVRKRKVLLEKGYCYIPLHELNPILVGMFRSKLSEGIAKMRRVLPSLDADERCCNFLSSLPNFQNNKTNTVKRELPEGSISADDVDELAVESFPPCMRALHASFKENHHMRHGARLQFGLFLKGIGLALNEAIVYLRREYCKRFTEEEFSKNFLYNIRHNYGEEGKRGNYSSYACMKIIMGNAPGPEDSHGCPFRHWDRSALMKFFNKSKIHPQVASKLCSLSESKHYDNACSCYFEAVHGQQPSQLISHPNQYYQESRQILTGPTEENDKKKAKVN